MTTAEIERLAETQAARLADDVYGVEARDSGRYVLLRSQIAKFIFEIALEVKSEAYEEAAQIVENAQSDSMSREIIWNRNPDAVKEDIAAAVRALKANLL